MTGASYDGDTGIDPGDVDVTRLREDLGSETGLTRSEASADAHALARSDVESARPLVSALNDRLDDENVNVLVNALDTLTILAEDDTDGLAGTVPGACALLDHDVPRVQMAAARLVRSLGVAHPSWFASHADALLAVLRTRPDDPTAGAERIDGYLGDDALREQLADVGADALLRRHGVRAVAGNLLVEVSAATPTAVLPHVEAVEALLDAEDLNVVACAAEVLGNVASADREAVRSAAPALVACLDGESDAVRAHAVRALGVADVKAAAEPIRALAEDETASDALREVASGTADWLERDA